MRSLIAIVAASTVMTACVTSDSVSLDQWRAALQDDAPTCREIHECDAEWAAGLNFLEGNGDFAVVDEPGQYIIATSHGGHTFDAEVEMLPTRDGRQAVTLELHCRTPSDCDLSEAHARSFRANFNLYVVGYSHDWRRSEVLLEELQRSDAARTAGKG